MNADDFSGRKNMPAAPSHAGHLPAAAGPEQLAGWTLPAADAVPVEQEEKFNVLNAYIYLLRYRWLILAFILAGLVVGALLTFTLAPKYRAEAMIEIMPPKASIFKDIQLVAENQDIRTFKTALTKLKSEQMLRRVAHELGLTQRKDLLNGGQGFSLLNVLRRVFGHFGNSADVEKLTPLEREQRAIEKLRAGLSVSLIRNTRIISIKYSSEDPRFAQRAANQFANSFIASRLDQTSETTRLARQFVSEQVAEVKKKLEEAEKKLVDYAKKEGLSLDEREGSLLSKTIADINDALSKAIQERLQYERLVRVIRLGRVMELQQVINNEALQKRREKIAELKGIYQQKLRTFKPSYPEMRELRGQIRELERLLKQDIQAIANGILLKYKVAKAKEQDLRAKLKELEAKQAAYQDKNIRYRILKREVDSYRSQYRTLIDKLNRLNVASQASDQTASIVQYASTPAAPYSPKLSRMLLISLALSIFAAVATIYVLELMNNTFSDPEQLEKELKVPVLGIIPQLPEKNFAEQIADPKSPISEAFRTLRTSLQFVGTDGAPRSLMVTSTEPGEGKSTISRKLAEEFGALGMNVLLIDADMRKPVQHRAAGIQNTIGLSNLLTNTVPASQVDEEIEIMRKAPWPNVWLVPAGTLPPNPANLLASQKMGLFVEACTNRFDIVIIDAPPVIGLADALLLSRLAEATLMVVAAKRPTRKAVHNAIRRLSSAGGYLVGTAFNRFRMDSVEYRYGYRYMNYGYLSYEQAYTYEGLPQPDESDEKEHATDGSAQRQKRKFADTLARILGRGRNADGGGAIERDHEIEPAAGADSQSLEHRGEDPRA